MFTDPSQLVAPIGATALLVYLIGIIIQERRTSTRERKAERTQWTAERATLIKEHGDAMDRALVDRDRTITYLQQRVRELTDEHTAMHRRLSTMETEHAQCQEAIRALARRLDGEGKL